MEAWTTYGKFLLNMKQKQKHHYKIIREKKEKKKADKLRKLKFYYHLGFTLEDKKMPVKA